MKKILLLIVVFSFMFTIEALAADAVKKYYVDHSQSKVKKAFSRVESEKLQLERRRAEERDLRFRRRRAQMMEAHEGRWASIQSANVSVVDGSVYTNDDGYWGFLVRGAVTNTGTTEVGYLDVTVNAYDSGDKLLDSQTTSIYGGIPRYNSFGWHTNALGKNDVGFFERQLFCDYDDASYVTVTVEYYTETMDPPQSGLAFSGAVTASNVYGDLGLSGNIQNPSVDITTYWTSVDYGIYNASGQVIEVGQFKVGSSIGGYSDSVAPGTTLPFTLTTTVDYPDYSSHLVSLQYQENEDSSGDSLTLTSPVYGDEWRVGETRNITWTSGGNVENVKLEYLNSDYEWAVITASTPNDGKYGWAIPEEAAFDYSKLKISDVDNNITSDICQSLVILPAGGSSLTVTSPNGGEQWSRGGAHEITWSSGGAVDYVKIEYYNGSTWSTIINSTFNDGSYIWTNSETSDRTSCLIRISEVGGSATDTSNGTFSIKGAAVASTITVTSPNGGESLGAGQSFKITWDNSSVTVSTVKIEYSYNGGATWTTDQARINNFGSYYWTADAGITSSNCYVRVSDADNASVRDTNDKPFSVSPAQMTVSRNELYFACIQNGSRPPDQSFAIDNVGGGDVYWTVSSYAYGVDTSHITGVNGAIVTVSVDPYGYEVGTHYSDITINNDIDDDLYTVRVWLTVMRPGDDQKPVSEFSTPADGAAVSSSIAVTGWAVDDTQLQGVKIYREEGRSLVYIGDAVFVEGTRPDIAAAYPTYPASYKAGWGYMLLTNFLPNGGNGTYVIHAVATDSEGREHDLGKKTIYSDNANAVKPFGAIDTPGQGGTASGSSSPNWGWALTPQPNSIPTDGSTISVWVNGVKIGQPSYNRYRADLAKLFPGYANTDGAVGLYYLDTTKYANGVHNMHWFATDSAGNKDGIGSRYFNIFNSGSERKGAKAESASAKRIPPADRERMKRADGFERNRVRVSAVADVHFSGEPVTVYRGFDGDHNGETVFADDAGTFNVAMNELGRVEIHLGQKGLHGYMMVNGERTTLPVGSTMDAANGVFYWQPGVGFLGQYQLVFLDASGRTGKRVNVRIKSKH